MEVGIRVHNGNETEQLDPEKIRELAKFYELDTLIPGRYTSLLVVNLYLLDKVSGVDPVQVINEIKSLEGLAPSQQTKVHHGLPGKAALIFRKKYSLSR